LDEGDDKFNLEVNYKEGGYGVYKCWVCGDTYDTHGSVKKLIRLYGTEKLVRKYEILMPDDDGEGHKRIYQKVTIPPEYISFEHASIGMKMTPYYKQAYNYLKKRNVTDELIKKFRIGFCYYGNYAYRIIIPSFNKDYNLNYFIARSYLSHPKMKYKNPEAEKDIIIFNEYLIDWERPIYIVEGAFDSIFLSNAIPMLGKHMSDYLFDILYEKAKKIIIVLDPDAWENAEKLYHRLNCGKLFNKVWIVHLDEEENKDIADLCGDLSNYEIKQLE
jgi:DNA primase